MTWVVLWVVALLGVGGAAQTSMPIPPREAKGFAAIDETSLKGNLRYLASDDMAGRMSLQPGDDAAVNWIAAQFAKADLEPAVLGPFGMPIYLQKFQVVEFRPARAQSNLKLNHRGEVTEWDAPEAVGVYKHAFDATAPVVFAGYGITAPELGYDDYKGIDAKGKIVLVFDHEPQEDDARSVFNGIGNTRYATTRVKLLNAQAHGAVALLVVAEPNRKHPTNAERQARIGGSVTRTTPLPLQALAEDEVHIPAITVVDAVAAKLLQVTGSTPGALQTALDKDLTPQGRDLADTTVTVHLRNISERTATTANVAGLLVGSDPRLKAETILISAHHDHDGEAPCPKGETGIDEAGWVTPAGATCMDIWHGADDNGSGTVGVIELAKAFAANAQGKSGPRPARSILFVVFASEERGLLGSYWMAAHPLRPLKTTRAMINFDMIGRDEAKSPQTDGLIEIPAATSNRLNLIGAPYSPDYDRIVKHEDEAVGLILDDRFDHDHVLNVFFRSDQFPFVLKNVPALWWFTGFHPDYHHITDTVEKIDYAKMRRILQLAYLTAWRFTDDPVPPRFVADPRPSSVAAAGGGN